ncbi:MAG TPA: HNH endonuclease [Nitrososphaeraceae archaeon]|nr:HNH endonuclease [Nitrososphaeraceae archaeon]
MKICSICKTEKKLEEFTRDKYKKDSKKSRCKECVRKNYCEKSNVRPDKGSKKCGHCQTEKNYEEFGSNKANFDGLHFWCLICARKKAKEYRLKYPENYEREKHKKFLNWRKQLGVEPEIRLRSRKGEGYVNRQGYLSFKKIGHPCADKNGRVQASHLVIYEYTGRILKKGESVHHKNGMRLDNSIENLEVWSSSQPGGQRIEDKINWCIQFLDENGYRVEKK